LGLINEAGKILSLNSIVEQTVSGLGYELVEIDFSARGLLRITIDLLAPAPVSSIAPWDGKFITVEDCEVVSRQLSYVFTVENVDYSRLEISSPGLDRPLNKVGDFKRFAGHEISLRLREPLAGRRNFEGLLSIQDDGQFALDWDEKPKGEMVEKGKVSKVGSKAIGKKNLGNVAKKTAAAQTKRLSFDFADVEKANLVPQVVFNRKDKSLLLPVGNDSGNETVVE
jgi:ribosome maturation factor RimP